MRNKFNSISELFDVCDTESKIISYYSLPTFSKVRNQLMDWFEEIHVDLDTVQDSATIQNSNSADTSYVFNYDPGPIDT